MQVAAAPIAAWTTAQDVANLTLGLRLLEHPTPPPIKLAIAHHLTQNWQSYPQGAVVSIIYSFSFPGLQLPEQVVRELQQRVNENATQFDKKMMLVLDESFNKMVKQFQDNSEEPVLSDDADASGSCVDDRAANEGVEAEFASSHKKGDSFMEEPVLSKSAEASGSCVDGRAAKEGMEAKFASSHKKEILSMEEPVLSKSAEASGSCVDGRADKEGVEAEFASSRKRENSSMATSDADEFSVESIKSMIDGRIGKTSA
jgi:hypothetical protein